MYGRVSASVSLRCSIKEEIECVAPSRFRVLHWLWRLPRPAVCAAACPQPVSNAARRGSRRRQPPAGQPPQPTPAAPAAPKVAFTTPAGAFTRTGEARSDRDLRRIDRQAQGGPRSRPRDAGARSNWVPDSKVYKAAEPIGRNALYVVMVDPAYRMRSTSSSTCCDGR